MRTPTTLTAAAAALLLLAIPTTATAKPSGPTLNAESPSAECWTGHSTLVHIVLRNTTDRTVRYRMNVTRKHGAETWVGAVARGQAVLEGFVVHKGETVPTVTATDDRRLTVYYRANTKSVRKCEHR